MAGPSFKQCPRCGIAMPFDQQQCQRCGEWQQTQAGNPNRTQAFFAQPPTANYPRPGYPYGSATQNQDRWLIALLLCIFLGHLGIHRFYMGHTGAGVAILLLSVIGWVTACVAIGFLFLAVAWVWTIVDLVLICTNQLRMADGTPLRY